MSLSMSRQWRSLLTHELPVTSIRRREIRVIIRVLREVEGFVEVADLGKAIARGSSGAGGRAVGGIVVGTGRGSIELVVNAGKRGQAEAAFDELQDRTVFVQLAGDVAASGPGRDHQHRHAET